MSPIGMSTRERADFASRAVTLDSNPLQSDVPNSVTVPGTICSITCTRPA